MNNLAEVERQCKMLMTVHGVGSIGFELDGAKKRIGACHYTTVNGVTLPVKITISKHFASILQMEEIRETMLHEIAHALTPGAGHGARWAAKCRELGMTHVAPKKATSARPEYSWEGFCPSCDNRAAGYHRAPLKAGWMCGAATCRTKKPLDRLLVWKKNGRLVPAQDMPDRYYRDWLRIQESQRSK